MASLAEDIAVIRTHVEYLRAASEINTKRFETHEADIDTLEIAVKELKDSRAYERKLAALIGAVVAFAFTHADKVTKLLGLLLAFCLMVGCLPPGRWKTLPTVAYPSDLPQECLDSTKKGLAWWEAIGVDYWFVQPMPGAWGGFGADGRTGYITINKVPEIPDAAGVTTRARFSLDPSAISKAVIEIDTCDEAVIRHELGHALGLPDLEGLEYSGRVMCWWVGCVGEELSPEERAWVVW